MQQGGLGGAGSGSGYGVQVAITIAAKNHMPRPEVLHRKTKGIKFYRAAVVTCELRTYRRLRTIEGTMRTLLRAKFDVAVARTE